MIYHWHDIFKSILRTQFQMAAAFWNTSALACRVAQSHSAYPAAYREMANHLAASAEMADRFSKDYPRPIFGLGETTIDSVKTAVTEQVVEDRAWCELRHFKRETTAPRNDPKVLLIAPMSGHYATLLRGTVEALLPHHDVFITDWKDAREVPKNKGDFSLEDYIEYVQDFIRKLGPDVHVIAVCQPTVPALAAVADLAATNDKSQPVSLTLMGGPVDTRAAETEVTKFAKKHTLDWFANNVIARVPGWYKGAGQMVYPGFLQLTGFMMMNPDRHTKSHHDLFDHLRRGDGESAGRIKEFYDEYLAVCDLSARFYLDTIDQVFHRQTLAKGQMTYKGRLIDPGKITKTTLFTVEGEMDDIAAPGQTFAAHKLCTGLSDARKFHYTQKGAGHYGIFNGRRWREDISPRIAGFIRDSALFHNLRYNDSKEKILDAEKISVPVAKPSGQHFKPR